MIIKTKKCSNCKFAGENIKGKMHAACFYPRFSKKDNEEIMIKKYTTNSKEFTHCNKHEFYRP